MSDRPTPPPRSAYAVFRAITTRWIDNDAFGHVNNVNYYSFFDTTVCGHLMAQGVFHPSEGDVIGLVVQSGCSYFAPVAFPDRIEGGVRVEKLGNSSIRYGIGIFREGEDLASAAGFFTHVYVDRTTRRPVPLPPELRAVAEALVKAS